jgi:hypothetical protein
VRVGRIGHLAPLGARSKRQHNEERCEPSAPVHCFHWPPDPPRLTRASDRLDQARVIVLDVADPQDDRLRRVNLSLMVQGAACLGRGIDGCVVRWSTIDGILVYARWIEEIAPGFIAMVIMGERGEDYRDRDLLDQVAYLIEIFGVVRAARIVGCP